MSRDHRTSRKILKSNHLQHLRSYYLYLGMWHLLCKGLWTCQTGNTFKKGRRISHFLGQNGENIQTKAWKAISAPLRLSVLSCLRSRTLPAPSSIAILSPGVLPFHPNLLMHCSAAPCVSLNFTCPTSKALQSSTSAYTFVLIFFAPTLACIPAPFLINPISHTPAFMASPMPSCMLTQVPQSLITFLLKSAAKLPYWAFLGPEPDPSPFSCMKNLPFPWISSLEGGNCDWSGFSVPSGFQPVTKYLNTCHCLPAVQY